MGSRAQPLCGTLLYSFVYAHIGLHVLWVFLATENFKIISRPLSGRAPALTSSTSLKDVLMAAAAGDWELGHSGLSI